MDLQYQKFLKLFGAAMALLVMAGCLPEDEILTLQFSPKGDRLATVSEKAGLRIIDIHTEETTPVATGVIDPSGIAWLPDENTVAYAAAASGSFDIFLSDIDGSTTQVTTLPARETFPMIRDNVLIYLTTESGIAAVTSHTLLQEGAGSKNTSAPGTLKTRPLHLPELETPIIHPVMEPSGSHLAFFTYENLRPQLCTADLATGKVYRLTKDKDPFDIITDDLAWSANSGYLAYKKFPTNWESEPQANFDAAAAENKSKAVSGSSLMVTYPSNRVLANNPRNGYCWPRPLDTTRIVSVTEGKLQLMDLMHPKAKPGSVLTEKLDFQLPVTMPAVGGTSDTIAFVAGGQLVGLTTPSLKSARIMTFDLEDKFLLAEEYFRAGNSAKSYQIYQELAASVTRTRDPEMAKFIYIANLRRLGKNTRAVAQLESLLNDKGTTHTVPPQYLWRILGYSYLLEQNDLPKARKCLQNYEELTSETVSANPDSALNALQILQKTPPETARLYGRAVKARLDGNFDLTAKLFGDLLTSASSLAAVRNEYMNALDGFDAVVYYFNPTQRPFSPTLEQQADYLQRFVDVVTTPSAQARRAKLDLFLLRIQTGEFPRARTLLRDALTSAPADSRPEGILEVFRNYLETPEPQPWINAAIPEVFLHPEIRPMLLAMTDDPSDRLLIFVAATKMALLKGNAGQARHEANLASAEWNRISAADQTGDDAALYGRLLVFRAQEAELRGLFAEAADNYTQALQMMQEKKAGNFEFQEETHYRGELLRMFASQYPGMAARLRAIEKQTGAELVNPTWDRAALKVGVSHYVDIYDTSTSTLKLWAAYEAGVCFGKMRRMQQSRAALQIAAAESAPTFLQRKALLELAATDEYLDDPWNAARWYARLAALPGTGEAARLWCSYHIARLHLSINYKVSAAREALGVIVSTRPDSPLATQAQELLVSTDVR